MVGSRFRVEGYVEGLGSGFGVSFLRWWGGCTAETCVAPLAFPWYAPPPPFQPYAHSPQLRGPYIEPTWVPEVQGFAT